MDTLTLQPFRAPLNDASVNIPGSKSITNRALLLASLSRDETLLKGVLRSEDTDLMIECLKTLGVRMEFPEPDQVMIWGNRGEYEVKTAELYVGTAGTVARLLIGVLGVQPGGSYRVDGSEVMRSRPMEELTDVLKQLGCKIDFHGKSGALPFTLHPNGFGQRNIELDASASSQVLSAILLASGLSGEEMGITLKTQKVRKPYVVMTTRLMESFCGPSVIWDESFCHFRIDGRSNPGYSLPERQYVVESDASAASYFLTLPLVVGGKISVFHFNEKGLQGDVHYAEVLRKMGAELVVCESGVNCSFPNIPEDELKHDFYAISDTFLTLAAITPLLKAPVEISGVAHTRRQESNRVSAMAEELRKLGQQVEEKEDSLRVIPDRPALLRAVEKGIEIETYRDHRIAMSFAILGCFDLFGDGRPWMTIRDPRCCEKTFPDFFETLERLRLSTEVRA